VIASGIVIGIVLLLFGRKIFWIFVGAAGFVAGIAFVREVLAPQPEWVTLVVALVAGLVGAVLSVFLETAAIGIAGFMIGGYVLASLAALAGYRGLEWVAWLGGGALAALLILMLLDPALIVLSSLAGATLIAQSVSMRVADPASIFVVALVIGLVVQFTQLRATAR
jgi:hypothetical protein